VAVGSKQEGKPMAALAKSAPSAIAKPKMVTAKLNESAAMSEPRVRAWDATLKSNEAQQRAALKRNPVEPEGRRVAASKIPKANEEDGPRATLLAETALPKEPTERSAPEYVTVREEFFMVVNQGAPSSAQASWQVHIVQISVVQAQPQQKQVPKKI